MIKILSSQNFLFRYHLDPSGTFIEYDAKAIGSGSEGAQQNLQDIFHKVNILNFLKAQFNRFIYI